MEVIGAGFGRTGTLSLKAALEQLGHGPCYHMEEVLNNPSHAKLWNAAARGRLDNWEKLFGGYRATVDWPAAYFWRELLEAYPDAKVLLSVRDPQRWYESMARTIFRVPMNGWRARLRMLPAVALRPAGVPLFRAVRAIVHKGTFGGVNIRDKGQVIDVFVRHNQEVERTVPADRLLVYEVGQGWEPLCAFLGVDVPDIAFPHLNDAAMFEETFGKRIRRVTVAEAAPALAILAGVALCGGLAMLRRKGR